jgi:hypothetical protein
MSDIRDESDVLAENQALRTELAEVKTKLTELASVAEIAAAVPDLTSRIVALEAKAATPTPAPVDEAAIAEKVKASVIAQLGVRSEAVGTPKAEEPSKPAATGYNRLIQSIEAQLASK